MRRLLFGLLLALAVEGSAMACACIGPQGAAQKREWARQIVKEAVAVAEVEQVEELDLGAMRPEVYRVHKVLVGKAPATFRLYRRFQKSDGGLVMIDMSDCDAHPEPGKREVVVLHDPRKFEADLKYHSAEERAKIARGDLDMWSMCERLFFELEGGLELVLDEARKLGKLGN